MRVSFPCKKSSFLWKSGFGADDQQGLVCSGQAGGGDGMVTKAERCQHGRGCWNGGCPCLGCWLKALHRQQPWGQGDGSHKPIPAALGLPAGTTSPT